MQAIRATAVLSVILLTKVVATNLGLGGAKMNAGGRAPEDKYQAKAEDITEEAKVTQDRAQVSNHPINPFNGYLLLTIVLNAQLSGCYLICQ